MNRDQRVDPTTVFATLGRCPFFDGLDVTGLQTLSQLVETRTYAAGEVLYEAGDEGAALTILAEGEVEHYVILDDEVRVVGKVTPVTAFGELSLLLPGPRMLGARAVQATTVHELTEGTLSMLSASDPRLALDLLKNLRSHSAAFLTPVRGILAKLFVQAIESAMNNRR